MIHITHCSCSYSDAFAPKVQLHPTLYAGFSLHGRKVINFSTEQNGKEREADQSFRLLLRHRVSVWRPNAEQPPLRLRGTGRSSIRRAGQSMREVSNALLAVRALSTWFWIDYNDFISEVYFERIDSHPARMRECLVANNLQKESYYYQAEKDSLWRDSLDEEYQRTHIFEFNITGSSALVDACPGQHMTAVLQVTVVLCMTMSDDARMHALASTWQQYY